MRGFAVVFGLVCACACVSFAAAQTYSQAQAQKYIETSESQWAESVATNDGSVVRRILADDVVWVLDGKILNKRQAVSAALNAGNYFVSDHLEYAHVRFFGNTAIAQGREIWKRKDGRTGRFIWTDTWMLRNGKWQVVAAQDTVVPI